MIQKHETIFNRLNGIFDYEDRIFAAQTEIEKQEKLYLALQKKILRLKNIKLKAKYEEELQSQDELLFELTKISEEEEASPEEIEEAAAERQAKMEAGFSETDRKHTIEELTGTKVEFQEEIQPGKVEIKEDLAPDWSLPPEPEKNNVIVQQQVTITPPPDQGKRITKTKTIKIPVKGKNLTAVINTIEKGIEKVFSFFKRLF